MKQQRGFTLIELIIVIVILGILAVTAAPRFIDVQSDARRSSLDGVAAAIQGASQLVYAKAAIGGVQAQATGSVTISTGVTAVATVFGYPDADAIGNGDAGFTSLQRFVDINAAEFDVINAVDDSQFVIVFQGGALTDNCQLTYTDAADANSSPTIVVLGTGC